MDDKYDYQPKAVEHCINHLTTGEGGMLYCSPTGSGKCLGFGTPVLMFDGSVKPVQEIVVGDRLMGPDSKPRKVRALGRGRAQMYRVTPVKGDSWTCNGDHILSIRKWGRGTPTWSYKEVCVSDFFQMPRKEQEQYRQWSPTEIIFGDVPAPALDPYFLGLWLGDGSSCSPSVTTADRPVVQYLRRFVRRYPGLKVVTYGKARSKAHTYHLTAKVRNTTHNSNPLSNQLRNLGVWGNKHIPDDYKRGSPETRRLLLAGLLDSDGSLTTSNCYIILTKFRKMSEDILYVCRSLGFRVSVRGKEHENGSTYYTIVISGDVDSIPTRLKRKQARPRRSLKDPLVSRFKVRKLGLGDYYGFELDGDGLFLLGDFTVTHNTRMQCEVLKTLPDLIQLVPGPDIAAQFGERLTGDSSICELSDSKIRDICERHRVFTYQRFYGLLSEGRIDPPRYINYDEAHHTSSNREVVSYEYSGSKVRSGWTATPYRGTPKETAKLLDAWDHNIVHVIRLPEAVRRGVIAHPEWYTWPLIDDEEIDITNGEFSTRSVEKVVGRVMDDLVLKIRDTHCTKGRFDRPSMIALTSERLCEQFHEVCRHHGVPSVVVTSKQGDRRAAFASTVACDTLLINIRVVGEGVDLPIRRLYDAAPTMSPVLWQQRVGRITRPTDVRPEYVALCRNLTRHAYLWRGVIPVDAVRKTQAAFGGVSKRDIIRGIGQLEGFGRFSPAPVPLAAGLTGSFYSLQSPDGLLKLGVLLHPLTGEPIYGTRSDSNGKRGVWRKIDELPDVKGWVSTHNSPLTPAMQGFWNNMAAYVGLDPTAEINSRSFQAMPFLKDMRLRIRVPDGDQST